MKRMSALICFLLLAFIPQFVSAEVLYSIDFTQVRDGKAEQWIKDNDFSYELDADELDLYFKNGALVISNREEVNGLIGKEVQIENAKRLRIEWGVNKYPKGADWENELYRDAVMIILSFGKEKISSGSFIIPNMPYFIGYFLSEKEKEGKAYTGSYFKKGGRYYCIPCGVETKKTVITEVNFDAQFKEQFKKSTVPAITAIAIESDARDMDGGSEAFIRKIEFLSE